MNATNYEINPSEITMQRINGAETQARQMQAKLEPVANVLLASSSTQRKPSKNIYVFAWRLLLPGSACNEINP